jgi:hypothetical protein
VGIWRGASDVPHRIPALRHWAMGLAIGPSIMPGLAGHANGMMPSLRHCAAAAAQMVRDSQDSPQYESIEPLLER